MPTTSKAVRNSQLVSNRLVGISILFTLFAISDALDAWAVQDEKTMATSTSHLTNLLYQSSISAAEKSLRLHEMREARRWLDLAPEKLRGWEWNYLNAQCDESLSSFPVAQQNVTAMDVSTDGKRFAVATAEGDITLYHLPDFTDPMKIGDHREAVYSVTFSDDSTRLVTVSRDVTSRVWDVETGKQLSQIKLDNPGVAEACISPSGKQIATCSWMMTQESGEREIHGTVWIWNAETGEVNSKQRVGVKPLDSIQWSSDGTKIVVGSWDGLVHILDDQANLLRTLTVPSDGAYTAVISVAISPNGKYIAAGSKDRTARVWDASDGELMATMKGHEGFVNSLQFTADSQRLVTASVDGTCRIWETATGKQLHVMHGHIRSVTAIDLSSDGELYSIGRDQELRRWNLSASYGGRLAFRVQPSGTYTTTFSPDGKRMSIACYDGQVRVVDTYDGSLLAEWVAHDASCNTLALNHDGTRMLTCSWDKTAKLWNTADRSLLKSLDAQAGIRHCAISPDGKEAALCVGNKLQVWNLETGDKTGQCEGHLENLSEVAFAPDGNTLATAASGEPVRLWNAKSCELITTLGAESDNANTVRFSHDGKSMATGRRGIVSIWDSRSHALKKSISFGDSPINQLAFSADDSRIAVASDAVYLLEPNEGVSLLHFQPNDDDIYFLAFSPDGSRLATCTAGGSIAINESSPLQKRSASPISTKPDNKKNPS